MKVGEFLDRINHVNYVNFIFNDLLGRLCCMTYAAKQLNVEQLELGIGFDGSSVPGWKDIQESDMLIRPDFSTAFLDPFRDSSLSVFCDAVDPKVGHKYDRDPRVVAQKAEEYLKSTGIADSVCFGPEMEFFVFDGVRFKNSATHSFFELESKDFPDSAAQKAPEGELWARS